MLIILDKATTESQDKEVEEWKKGIKTFDASVGGLGGCPYSPGAKGNVATEKVNKLLISLGYRTNLNAQKIDECSEMALKLKMGKNYD